MRPTQCSRFDPPRGQRARIVSADRRSCQSRWALLSARGQDLPGKDAWIPLFNGKDLQGWKPKIKGHDLGDNFGNTFRVEERDSQSRL